MLGYAMTFDQARDTAPACLAHPLGLAVVRRDDSSDEPFFQATGAICNLPVLTKAANASGFLNAAPDPDGLLRRVPLLMRARRPRLSEPRADVGGVDQRHAQRCRCASHNVNASSLLRRQPERAARRQEQPAAPLSAAEAHVSLRLGRRRAQAARSAPELFKDKIVLVGTTALGTREVVSTPLDTLFAGVEVQATVADNLLQQDFIRRPEYAVDARDAARPRARARLGARSSAASGWHGAPRPSSSCLAVLWFGSVRLMSTKRRLPLAALPDDRIAVGAGSDDRRAVHERAAARRSRPARTKATSQRLMVQSLLSLTEVRDAETGKHSRRTQEYTRVLAQQLSTHPDFRDYLTPERIELLASLAPLHDIGKVGVPDQILNKPAQLTPEELVEMRKHPGYGRDVIVHAEEHAGVHDDVILRDGEGHRLHAPREVGRHRLSAGPAGVSIPIPGRVMAIVDVYDASTTRQLYRTPLSHDEAVAFIVKGRGTHFDPDVVDAFLQVSPMFRELSTLDELVRS